MSSPQANPWLLGSLVREHTLRGNKLFIHTPDDSDIEKTIERAFRVVTSEIPVMPSSSAPLSHVPYNDLVAMTHRVGAVVDKGSDLVRNRAMPVSRLTVITQGAGGPAYFVAFSINHCAADGFTYYRILSMLSADTEVEALDPTRDKHAGGLRNKVCGKREMDFMTSFPQLVNWVMRVGCNAREKPFIFEVDKVRVENAKFAETESPECKVPFVSTNDVLVSSYGEAVGARVVYMAMNLRNRLGDGFRGNSKAGNYEGSLLLGQNTFSEPSLIRKKLLRGPPYARPDDSHELPCACEAFVCTAAQVTSWAFPQFPGSISVPNSRSAIHLPIPMFEICPFELAIIFKPSKEKLAMLLVSRLDPKVFSAMPLVP